jgi:hypothetical protein
MPFISAANAGHSSSSSAGEHLSTIAVVGGSVAVEVPEKSKKENGNSGGQAVAACFMQPSSRCPPAPSLVVIGIGYVPLDPAGTLLGEMITLAQLVMMPVAQQLTRVNVVLLMPGNAVKKPNKGVL